MTADLSLATLSEGICLENLGKLLPWNIGHRDARALLGLETMRPDKITLAWDNQVCLDGLPCQIAGKFILEEAFIPEKRALRLIEFRPQKADGVGLDEFYANVRGHLAHHFGQPSLDYDGSEGSLRSFSEWDTEDVMVMWKITRLGLEAEEECVGEIWRKPFPKEYLKLTLSSF